MAMKSQVRLFMDGGLCDDEGEPGNVFYHATPLTRAEAVLDQGLLRNQDPNWKRYTDHARGKVFLTKGEQNGRRWAFQVSWIAQEPVVLLAVTLTEAEIDRLEMDYKGDEIAMCSFYATHDIGPDRLEVHSGPFQVGKHYKPPGPRSNPGIDVEGWEPVTWKEVQSHWQMWDHNGWQGVAAATWGQRPHLLKWYKGRLDIDKAPDPRPEVPKDARAYAKLETEPPAVVLAMVWAQRSPDWWEEVMKIWDGNHRLAAAALRGDTDIEAYVGLQ